MGFLDNRLPKYQGDTLTSAKNEFDSMGGGDAPKGDYSVEFKYASGWIPESKVKMMHPQGSSGCTGCVTGGTFTIYPMDKANLPPNGQYSAVRVYLATQPPRYVWLQVRSMYTQAANQVLMDVCDVTGASYLRVPASDLIDSSPEDGNVWNAGVSVGQTFHFTQDSTGGSVGITVRPTAHSGGSVTVAVSYSTPINVAQGKSATQINTRSAGGAASRAVDGNTDGRFNRNSVTHTATASAGNWWKLDLGGKYSVSQIKVYNRLDCCKDALSNFEIWCGKLIWAPDSSMFHLAHEGTFSATVQNKIQNVYTFAVNNRPMNMVRIRTNLNKPLMIAEVQVTALPGVLPRATTTAELTALDQEGLDIELARDRPSTVSNSEEDIVEDLGTAPIKEDIVM
eukprot:JP446063.1.p1 GENE.JP446063.1~~JP446063.1.p1  ORF type:complete len:396 (-),score=101.69 JP446063.1:93-1280(-)